MGKTTGFLEYARTDAPDRPPEERVWDWNEFHQSLPSEEQSPAGRTVHGTAARPSARRALPGRARFWAAPFTT